RRAAEVLRQEPARPVRELIERCHTALRGGRGAVMTLATIDLRLDQLTWTAIGNVEATLCRADGHAEPRRETIVPRGGVVGYQLPPLREVTLPLARGDVLILATDGIAHDFILETPAQTSAPDYASHLLGAYAKDTDDALVLVVRYLGGPL
ncbi:MAG TPA: SpoIIE family protein phosphatase, partial [Caulobacter sp.]|nr:SpoIIE family protein phosphatase [Caulobacter sp.]